MELESRETCQWYNCLATASMHVVFGLRLRDADADAQFSTQVYAPEHFDLCPAHTVEVGINYYFSEQFELGKCLKRHLVIFEAPLVT